MMKKYSKRMRKRDKSKMRKTFLTNLPIEITTNILTRLPPRAIVRCKCVCKSWLELLDSNDFLKSRLSRSIPGLVIHRDGIGTGSNSYDFFEFEDEDAEDLGGHDYHYYPLTKFDFPVEAVIKGSANGLLLMLKLGYGESECHYVCNPFTREYIEVHCPEDSHGSFPYEDEDSERKFEKIEGSIVWTYPQTLTYGFGASKTTGQYKVVRIFHESVIAYELQAPRRIIPESECHVYTMGTGSWRRVAPGGLLEYSLDSSYAFLNGYLHWVVSDSDSKTWISCFDLETERFSTFSAPPVLKENTGFIGGLSSMSDCLCLCDHTREYVTVIWLMKEYGVEQSWTMEYVIKMENYCDIDHFGLLYAIKAFKDGDILMLTQGLLFCYSHETRTADEISIFSGSTIENYAAILSPSSFSLKSLKMENVISF